MYVYLVETDNAGPSIWKKRDDAFKEFLELARVDSVDELIESGKSDGYEVTLEDGGIFVDGFGRVAGMYVQ